MKPADPPRTALPAGAEPRHRDGLPIGQALARSAPLARLAARLRDAAECYAAVRPLLPDALAEHLTAGPIDESGWTLLAANAAVAAKLRQLKPRLEERLREHGGGVSTIRVKILPAGG